MLGGIQQWLHQNAPWLDVLNSLVGILVVVIGFFVFKPLRWAIPKLWSSLSRPFKTGAKRPHVILDFVAMDFPSTQWVIGKQDDKLHMHCHEMARHAGTWVWGFSTPVEGSSTEASHGIPY